MLTSTRSARPRAAVARRARASVGGALYPLDFVYARAGVPPPIVTPVVPDDIPQPYRSLLVHESDMTVTLERHFGGRVVLRPLSTLVVGPSYFRRVLLAQEYSGRPVEMGAIRIRLDAFSARIRTLIQRNEIPLGRILRDGDVDFKSVAKLFLAVTPNPEMMGIFWMREARTLYGRRTEVISRGAKVGDIVEVLPLV
jgi:chorismate-pyruvate lyase